MRGFRHDRVVPPALVAMLFFGTLFVVVTSGDGDDAPPTTRGSTSTTTTTTATTPARGNVRTMIVKSGDSPTSIAQRAGITLDRLLELNDDLDPRTLRPGQKLRIGR